MTRDRLGTVWGGLALIGLGVAFLLAQWLGWEQLWPVFPIFGGLAFLAGYVTSGFKESGLVFVGVGGVLVGLFFFGFTLGYWEWEAMAQLWPMFPLIGGVAFFALFLAERGRDLGTLGVGCAAVLVGLGGLAFTYDYIGGDIVKLWPLLIILVGLFALASGVRQMFRRE